MEISPPQRQQVVRHAVLQAAGENAIDNTANILSITLHLWQCLARELSAIIGEAGFQSIYLRSQHLSAARYHFLLPQEPGAGNSLPAVVATTTATTIATPTATNTDTDTSMPTTISVAEAGKFAPLLARLAAQPPAAASLASTDLLGTFLDTLALLIGEHLTSTILRSAWGDSALDAKEHHE